VGRVEAAAKHVNKRETPAHILDWQFDGPPSHGAREVVPARLNYFKNRLFALYIYELSIFFMFDSFRLFI
jgi:hypothetical protein